MTRNVFADIGFEDDHAAEMALRVAVAVQIRDIIRQRELTQADAKALFGVPQPTISKVMRLQLANLSLAFLLRMLFRAGIPFTLGYGGSSQSIEVDVQGAAGSKSVTKDWALGAQSVDTSVEADVRPNSQGTHEEEKSWRPRPGHAGAN